MKGICMWGGRWTRQRWEPKPAIFLPTDACYCGKLQTPSNGTHTFLVRWNCSNTSLTSNTLVTPSMQLMDSQPQPKGHGQKKATDQSTHHCQSDKEDDWRMEKWWGMERIRCHCLRNPLAVSSTVKSFIEMILMWCWPVVIHGEMQVLISLSTQYEQKPLYFHISNVSHRHKLIATHCTDMVPPTAYASLHDRSLMLHVQVTLFAQHHFNAGQLFFNLGHFQQFRQRLMKPATIHTQRCLQNLVKPALPLYYCSNIVVLFIVLYCITIATVSCLTHPVAGTTSHMTHCATQLLSQVASLYSLLFSRSTLPMMHT